MSTGVCSLDAAALIACARQCINVEKLCQEIAGSGEMLDVHLPLMFQRDMFMAIGSADHYDGQYCTALQSL